MLINQEKLEEQMRDKFSVDKLFGNNSSDEKTEGQEKEDFTKPRVVQRYSQYTEQNTDIQDFTDHVEETNIAQSENNLVSETNILKAKSFFEKIKEKILSIFSKKEKSN